MIPKAYYPVTLLRQKGASPLICFLLHSMLASVKFHHQAVFHTAEVGDETADRMLTTELGIF
jgi:hypothetical protein